mgnify:CR=1 FL=1
MFKDSGDGNIDATKILLQAVENKIYKKFSFTEDKIKKCEIENQKLIEDFTNNTNSKF